VDFENELWKEERKCGVQLRVMLILSVAVTKIAIKGRAVAHGNPGISGGGTTNVIILNISSAKMV